MLDRYPTTPIGHLAFIEWVRDELHLAAEAKRNQSAKGYPNDTLASMVRGIKWAEAASRAAMLRDQFPDAVGQVVGVLRRDLSVGTVEHLEELLRPAVGSLRDALEASGDDNFNTAVPPMDGSHMTYTDANNEFLAKIGNLKGILASRATNGNPSEEEYGKLRAELVKIEPIRQLLPRFVLACRTIREFWAFIKPKFPTHKARLAFLHSEFDPILTALEQRVTPAASGLVYFAAPKPDLVLITVNEHETQAVHDAFRKVTGSEGLPVSLEGRLYHSLGSLNGTTVYHAISEIGSGGPGAMQQAVDKVIRARPRSGHRSRYCLRGQRERPVHWRHSAIEATTALRSPAGGHRNRPAGR